MNIRKQFAQTVTEIYQYCHEKYIISIIDDNNMTH